jgi:chemotaxis protein MotB
MSKPDQPIIIKKRGGAHKAHHGGAWKVAYADFVTAMMALFIVLWLMNTDAGVQKAVGAYFKDPTGSGKMLGSSLGGVGESLQLEAKDMKVLKERLSSALKSVPEFQKLQQHVEMMITGEGLRIELLETAKGVFFESGNSSPTESARKVIRAISSELGKLPNRILIEGHTDSQPYGQASQYSNWELSSDRANAARRLMEGSGLRAGQVFQVRGYADQKLREGKSAHDPSNRRISMIVQFHRPEEAAEPVKNVKPSPTGHSN